MLLDACPLDLSIPPWISVVPRLTSFIIILLMVSAVASVLVNATGPKAGDPLSYTTGGGRVEIGAWFQIVHGFRNYINLFADSEWQTTRFDNIDAIF